MNSTTGEASESSEDEFSSIKEKYKPPKPTANIITNKNTTDYSNIAPSGIIVSGEAPESDEEENEKISVPTSSATATTSENKTDTKVPIKQVKPKNVDEIKYKSLLHKKLRERNMSLWRNITDLIHTTTTQATKDLNSADQQLLKSQGVLQETAIQIHSLKNNLQQINDKLIFINNTSLFPK